jgi:hypothetical protein
MYSIDLDMYRNFQQNLKKDDSIKRPRYKKLESTELIEQNANSEQRFRHFNSSKFKLLTNF